MGKVRALLCAAIMAFGISGLGVARAAETPAEPTAEAERIRSVLQSLKPVDGDVALTEAGVTLHMGDRYYFLDQDDARKVIVDIWRNPPASADGVLGIVFPKGGDFPISWGAVVTYEKTFYVSDKDAETADYNSVLRAVWSREEADNAERTKAGYPAMHLVGWAQPPRYDSVRHTLIWARDIQTSDTDVHTLNYDVRILGREGVLSLNMIASMPELAQVSADAEALADTAAFNPGRRYADYVKGDKVAEYGLAGLVAAGVGAAAAKKLGLLAALLLFLKKGAVFVAAGFAIVAGWFGRRFGRKRVKAPAVTEKPLEPQD